MNFQATAEPAIHDVTDTATWVAYYRFLETKRPDALFNDPLAATLIGEHGIAFGESIGSISAHVQLNVVVRTVIIDRFIARLLADQRIGKKIDTIINLGAGLDTRPYRLALPRNLHWIEVDHPRIIELKNQKLVSQPSACRLTRVALDLSDKSERQTLLSSLNNQTKAACILTEGVLPYLSQQHVNDLSQDLLKQENFRYWIADFIAADSYHYLRSDRRMKILKNAPFEFFPPDWKEFFVSRGWKIEDLEFIQEQGQKLGRLGTLPLGVRIMLKLLSEKKKKRILQSSGYMLMSK